MALVKICGIKTLDEASAVCALDVDFIGLIFAKSKRRVELNLARQIAKFAHSKGKKVVGVFAEQSDCEIMEICQFAGLDVAQVHGVVSENLGANLKDMGLEIWKVFSVKDSLLILSILTWRFLTARAKMLAETALALSGKF